MKEFLKKTIFFLVPITLVLFSGIAIPPTPRESESNLFANRQKDSLLAHTKAPRIIFVGGSNLSFGLNSREILDSLNLNPINTAINAGIGIKYMLENTQQYIKKGDIVILAFEYQHFYRSYDYTSDALLRIICDVCPEKRKLLSLKQKVHLIPLIPRYSLTKLKPTAYFNYTSSGIYSTSSFNQFGDVDTHWSMEPCDFEPMPVKGNFNEKVIDKLKAFERIATQKGAEVYVTFPCIDEMTFSIYKEKILRVEKCLIDKDFSVLGDATKYVMPKELMFNTAYHLNKKGLGYRTKLFIDDYRNAQLPSGTLASH